MSKHNLSYLKALVIVHGKSELQIAQFLRQKLKLPIEILGEKKGKNSIQITSIMKKLQDTEHRDLDAFQKKYLRINVTGKGKKRVINNFKFFYSDGY